MTPIRGSFSRAIAGTAAAILACGAPSVAQDWKELGPAPMTMLGGSTGRVSALICSPTDPDRYFVAGADGGVWRTTDGGITWTPLTDHMPTLAIGALAFDPTDEDIIYAGSGEANFANHSRYGLGLFKSADGGESWEQLAEGTFGGRCFSKIVVNPRDPRVLFASITRAGGFPELAAAKGHPQAAGPQGVFRSDDGGTAWMHLTNGLPDEAATDLAMDPADPDTLYAAIGRIFGAGVNGIYKTTDGGASWTKLGGGLPASGIGRISLAIAPSNPSRLYALLTKPSSESGGGASVLGAFRSSDAGATWVAIGNGVSQATYGWYLSVVGVHPADPDTVFFGGLNLSRSTNAGASYSTVTPPHVDQHAIAFDAAGRLVAGDDGGVHRSTNLGGNWNHLNTGLGTVQFYAGLSTHPANDLIVFGGAQDNGSNRRNTDTKHWTTVGGGDGGWTQLDQLSPNIVFIESQGTGNLMKSTDGGNSFSGSGAGISGRNCFLPPYIIDPTNSSRILYGTERIFRSMNGGSNWTAISPDLTKGTGAIRALAIAPSDPGMVYAATNDGNVQVSFDGGFSFNLIKDDQPGWPRVTREVWVHPHDGRTMYLAGAAFGATKVQRTRDAGETWEPLDATFPDIPVNVVAVDARGAFPVLYAGSDAGLYRSTDDGATWHAYGHGLPNAAVIDIRIEPWRNRMLIGTQGRGAWSVPICISADFHPDGLLNIEDFIAFQIAFAAADPRADYSGDGNLDIDDFLAFQSAFAIGCP